MSSTESSPSSSDISDGFDPFDAFADIPFMNRLLDTHPHRGHRRRHSSQRSSITQPRPYHRTHSKSRSEIPLMTTLFSNHRLAPTAPLVPRRATITERDRRREAAQQPHRNSISNSNVHNQDRDEYCEDLELSFASNVSLNSPPRTHVHLPSDAMDISPMPPSRRTTLDIPPKQRLQATHSQSRLFGSDISNGAPSLLPNDPAKGTTGGSKKLGRSSLPFEWMSSRPTESVRSAPIPILPSSPGDDAMDVDTSYAEISPPSMPMSSAPRPIRRSHATDFASPDRRKATAATSGSFNNLFHDTISPRRSFESPSKPLRTRRSFSPSETMLAGRSSSLLNVESSPGDFMTSPSELKVERNAARALSKPSLSGLGAPSATLSKRPRRSEGMQPSTYNFELKLHSASPGTSPGMLSPGAFDDSPSVPKGRGQLARRAFSALLPPSIYQDSECDSSFEGPPGVDMSSPAQAYSHRQQSKGLPPRGLRRCDGTDDFRAAGVVPNRDSPGQKFMAPGLGGFGDNEALGKVLPCHKVREDGLMRINVQTMDELLEGVYDDRILEFQVIDCRFDYEYAGGHIEGAININTTAAVEEYLLGPGAHTPRVSVSTDPHKKKILIFHCEFSAKRAPTFAKHLRGKDRAINNHTYPRIFYPEIYILEGGYCGYYKESGRYCQPNSYVTMDDPDHARSRQADLDQFRKAKFGRHKSYAYGEMPMKTTTLLPSAHPQGNSKRNSASNPLFAAASAARSRRSGSVSLMTLQEDSNQSIDHSENGAETEEEPDIGDSPCPPPNKGASKGLTLKKREGMTLGMGMLKTGMGPLKRDRHLVRSETYNVLGRPLNFK